MESSGNEDQRLHEKTKNIFDIMRILTVLLDGENQGKSVRRYEIHTQYSRPIKYLGGQNQAFRILMSTKAIPTSIYMQQMSFTTEERTAILAKQERGNKSITNHASVRFRTSPRIVVFQQFYPGNTYRVTLVVKNISSVPQCLKVISTNNPWFTIERKDAMCSRKLAPGMSVVYDVVFSPEEKRDHEYRVLFDSGTETFAVPVYAIGPRPILDFPDVVEVPRTAVKIHSSKCLLVRNIGQASAVFSLSTNRPFAVEPQKGVLREGETMQVTVDFLSNEKGCFEEKLSVRQETGEIVSLNLRGSAESCLMRIERETVIVEDTYLGLTRSKTFAIHNDSDYVSNFRWSLYENAKRDRLELEKYETSFGMIKNIEIARKVDLEHFNICDSSVHELACQRVLEDEVSCLMHQTFPFRHTNYRLIPSEGEISPRGTVVVTLFFEPDKIGVIEGEAYLEITGYEQRIRLKLHGTCIGPLMNLNVASVDLGCIFLCSMHNYEVICGNKGQIPGTLMYSPSSSDSGSKIIASPVLLKLEPGEFKSINLSFSSNRNGDFVERVEFIVKESSEVISLRVMGSVIRPTLHFDKQSLDFGVTALGFSTKRDVGLYNSSLVPVTFGLTVMQDGTQPALTHEQFVRSMSKSTLAVDPKEFTIVPNKGVVAPNSFQRIEVTYMPNIVKLSQTAIRAVMWDSDSEPVMLPVTFIGKVASLVVRPSEILIKFCFMNVPYTRTITIENKSEVEGYFYLPPQSVVVNSAVVYSLSLHQGYLKPCESRTISLKIITTVMGRQKAQLGLQVFGERSLVTCCTLICNGQGPVVTVQPTQLDWGKVRLLNEVEATITLFNESPIQAQFNARVHKKLSSWTVRPSFGSLEPNVSLELIVSVYLRDTGKYSDVVDIEIANGRTISCSVSAIGIGSSIDLNPNMTPVFDMGLLFRNQDTSVPITMTNKGTKHHRLAWSTAADSHQVLQKNSMNERQCDKFTIEPDVVEIPPNGSVVVHCRIRWEANESIEEQWYLYGQIKGQGKREVLDTSIFTATFTVPNISFSARKLIFRHDTVLRDSNKAQLTDTLCVTNRSGLDLSTRVNIDSPFEIVSDEGDAGVKSATIALHDGVVACVHVRFNVRAIDLATLYPRIIRGTLTFDYGTHREQDKIECIAKWNYPNVSGLPKVPLTLACEVGSTACKNLILVNTGDSSVHYSFEFLESHARNVETFHDTFTATVMEDKRNSTNEISSSNQSALVLKDEDEPEERFDSIQCDDIRDFIFPMMERYIPEVTEIVLESVLEDMRTLATATADEPQKRESETEICPIHLDSQEDFHDRISQTLDVVSREGNILPHSSQYVYFQLDGSQGMKIDAKLVCRVRSGTSETIIVQAVSDVIRYSIDKNCIDFHDQLFFDLCRETLTIVNEGTVEFAFQAHRTSNSLKNEDKSGGDGRRTEDTLDTSRLTIEPTHGVVHPGSSTCLEIVCYPGIPGPIRETLDLEIGHHAPMSIPVGGYASLPQIYLTVRRGESFKRLPIDVCYQAIGSLTAKFLVDVKSPMPIRRPTHASGGTVFDDDLAPVDIPISKLETERLTANGWELISGAEELPTPVDIEMAIERSLTIEFLRQSPFTLVGRDSTVPKRPIPSLFVPEYIIDFDYVVIERVASYSAMLFNYGPASVEVRLAKPASKYPGIVIRFGNRTSLPIGESTPLNVTFHPRQSKYGEKRTDIEHTFHLEVTHGASIPICLRAVATYPCLTAHTAHVAFGEVAISHCFMMPVLLRNDGWVPCRWEATIRCEDSNREENGPFFIRYSADTFSPCQERVVNVYFRPTKGQYFEGRMNIQVKQSIFPVSVMLSGTGFEPALRLSQESLTFEPALPYTRPSEKVFLVENLHSHPVELFWRNFDRTFIEEARVIRILTHYYGVDEILFPPRKPGKKLSPVVYEFYQNLVDEMKTILVSPARSSEGEKGEEKDVSEEDQKEERGEKGEEKSRESTDKDVEESRRFTTKYDESSRRASRKRKPWTLGGDLVYHDCKTENISELLSEDPDRTEALLHLYIDELREQEDFLETMKDPMKAVFENDEAELSSVDRSLPLRRFCIIFHGAPFTEYQHAAYRISKMTEIPVLNITDAVSEVIAAGNSVCSNRLREIVDENYYRLLATVQPYRAKEQSSIDEVRPGATGNGDADLDADVETINRKSLTERDYRVGDDGDNGTGINSKSCVESEVLDELNDMPRPEELESMNPSDEYAYKIQSILLSQKIMSTAREETSHEPEGNPASVAGTANRKSDSSGAKKLDNENTFLGIDDSLIFAALKERLSMEDYRLGFILQSLENVFMKNESDTLVMLLNIVGNSGKLLFITFYNTLNLYLNHHEKQTNSETEMEAAQELANKLTELEEMTWKEYKDTSEDNKLLYASNTLTTKKADSLRRRASYNRNMVETMTRKKILPSSKRTSIAAKIGSEKIEKSLSSRTDASQLTGKNKATSASVVEKMIDGNYGKRTENTFAKVVPPKNFEEISRLMDMYQTSLAILRPVLANWDPDEGTDPASIGSEGVEVWYVAPTDPWNSKLDNTVAFYLSEREEIKNIKAHGEGHSGSYPNAKLYYVASRKSASPSPASLRSDAVYTLTSVCDPFVAEESDVPVNEGGILSTGGVRRENKSRELGSIVTPTEESLRTRWIMQPNETLKFKVQFAPKAVGIYKYRYELSIVDSNVTRRIQIHGSADIPRLSATPEDISRKIENNEFDDTNKPTYFPDTEVYDFGSMLLAGLNEKRVQKRNAKFYLSNISTLPATTTIFRMKNSEDFKVAPDLLDIAPGKTDVLDLWAGVSRTGLNSERLVLCIKNNPQAKVIQLQSYGSKLEVELNGRTASFGKMLLWRTEKRTITVKNKSGVALYWKLDLSEDPTGTQVTLHPTRSHIESFGTSDIECRYYAKSVGTVERNVPFRVFLGEHDAKPLLTDAITVTGETYDIKVDVIDANPIDLKNVQVGSTATEQFSMRNCGPFDIEFVIQSEMPNDLGRSKFHLPISLLEDLIIEPSRGSLHPGQAAIVQVNFVPRSEIIFREAPLFKCRFVDTREIPVAIAEIPILVSASVYHAKIEIQPSSGLDFGYMAVFAKRTMHLNIKNVGFFPFRYKITRPVVSDNASDPALNSANEDQKDIRMIKTNRTRKSTERESKADERSSRGTKITKVGGDGNIVSLKEGPFVLSNNEGTIEAGDFETIAVECCPTSEALFEKELEVFVPNTEAKGISHGEPLKLSVAGCIPTVDLCDLDSILRENVIVESLTDFKCPRELGPHSVFARQEKSLYIQRVILFSEYTTRLRLRNPGFVFSEVTVMFQPEEEINVDRTTTPFSIEPQKLRIAPMSTEIITISFSPRTLGICTAVLKITLELPSSFESQRLDIKVCGEGIVPKIALIEPTLSNVNDQILINFDRTLVGETGCRLLSLKNIGFVEASVILDASTEIGSPFSVQNDCRVRRLIPEEIFNVNVSFAPNEVGKYEGSICVLTVNNPYEKIILLMLGESYSETVVLQGLELADSIDATSSLIGKKAPRPRKSSGGHSQLRLPSVGSTESINRSITIYKLQYGTCFLNEAKRICFKISNRSETCLFRFEWSPHPNVVFSPSIGYINKSESKCIVASFFASEPIVYTQAQLECKINEVNKTCEEENETSWDNRQRDVRWETGEAGGSFGPRETIGSEQRIFEKVEGSTSEPIVGHIVPDSTRTVRVMVCAIAAYSQYSCSVKEINLEDTFMFQSCRYVLTLANPGTVETFYEWNFMYLNARYPTRLENSALQEVLRSFDEPCKSHSEIMIEASSETLQQKDHRSLQNSQIGEALDPFVGTALSSDSDSTGSWAKVGFLPFKITPEAGILQPGESIECTLVFSPLDVFDYKMFLVCRMKNLDPELVPLKVKVTARSLLPYYHFHVPEGDYLSKNSDSEVPLRSKIGDASADALRMVEFKAIGIGQTVVKKIRMTNPTGEDYRFSWRQCGATSADQCMEEISCFDCALTEGLAERGKQTEFTFTFLAKNTGVFESLWIFSIEKYNLETKFLFYAKVVEPAVYLLPGHVRLKPTVTSVTRRSSITIFNMENAQFSFRVLPESLHATSRADRLIVKPMSGILHPNSEQRLEIKFRSSYAGESEFCIRCYVGKLMNPLVAFVSAVVIIT